MHLFLYLGLSLSVCGVVVAQPMPPVNDDCSDAIEIYLGSTSFTTVAASTDGNAHGSCDFDGQTYNDIWYTFTSGCQGTLIVSTCGTVDYDSDLVVYLGDDCNYLELLDCNDDAVGCSGYSSHVEIPVYFGDRITVRVGGWNATDEGSGTLLLNIVDSNGGSVDSPANDECEDAIDIIDGDWDFTTVDATTDGDVNSGCEFDGQTYHDIWYRYVAPVDGLLTLSTCGQANYDTDLVIYNGTECGSLSLLGCNDDWDDCEGYSSYLEVEVNAGLEYLIRVGGWSDGDYGTGVLTVSIDGETVTWIGGKGASWFDGNNWSSGVVPSAGVDVEISGTVSIDQAGAEAASVTVLSGGVLRMENTSSSLTTSNLFVDTGGSLDWIGGTIDVSSGYMSLASDLFIGCVDDATLVADYTYIIADNVTICSNGTLTGNCEIYATLVENMGTISPGGFAGGAIGYVYIAGEYIQADIGTLEIELASEDAYDRIYVGSGSSTLDGILKIISYNNFSPTEGASFQLVYNQSEANAGWFTSFETIGFLPGTGFYTETTAYGYTITATLNTVWYVDGDNTSGNGTSWAQAFPTLQDALSVVPAGDQIWVAEGIYTPGTTRDSTFDIPISTTMFGGFDGTETSFEQRDIEANPTILSGNINNTSDESDDAYHVVSFTPAELGVYAVIDGCTITRGMATGPESNGDNCGGGIIMDGGLLYLFNCTIDNNKAADRGGGAYVDSGYLITIGGTISNNGMSQSIQDGNGGGVYTNAGGILANNTSFINNAANFGGSLYSSASYTTLISCEVTDNDCYLGGGGVYSSTGTLEISDCTFTNNRTPENSVFGNGGGIYAFQSETTITGSSFVNNMAGDAGGGIFFNEISVNWIAFINQCEFKLNQSPRGSAFAEAEGDGNTITFIANSLFIANDGNVLDMSVQSTKNRITNCTIASNFNLGNNAAIMGSVHLENSIVWGNIGSFDRNNIFNQINGPITLDHCIVDLWDSSYEGTFSNTAVTSLPPNFRSRRGPDGILITGDEDYRLLPNSYAIDSGDNDLFNYPDGEGGVFNEDLDSNNRFEDDPYTQNSYPLSTIDIGCYEYQTQVVGVSGFRVWNRSFGDYNFSDDPSWDPAEAPGVNDSALFEDGSPIFNEDATIHKLIASAGVIDFKMNNHTLTITDPIEPLMVGHQDNTIEGIPLVQFGISNGTIISNRVDVSGFGDGRLWLNNGTILASEGVILREGGVLHGLGSIQGDLYNSGWLRQDGGRVEYPTISGDYNMTDASIPELEGSGTLTFYVIPTLASNHTEYAKVVVDGTSTLGGVLQLWEDGDPDCTYCGLEVGESVTIFESAEGFIGYFDSILATGFGPDVVPVVSIVPGDGKSESIIVTIYSVSGLLGFGEPDATNIDSLPKDVELADFDGDGFHDLVLSLSDIDQILVLYNGGMTNEIWNGFSGGSQQLPVGDNPAGLTAGDFDDDGDIDIAVANTNNDTISLYENQTSARGIVTFTAHTPIAADYYTNMSVEVKPTDVTSGNFSDSGHVDLAFANSGDSMVVIVEGPLFSSGFLPNGSQLGAPGGASQIDPGDTTNPKDLDVITATGEGGKTSSFKGVTALTSNYGAPTVLNMGDSLSEQLVADLDGNGQDDLIVVDPDSNAISIALQNSDGTFRTPATLLLDAPLGGWYVSPQSVAALDLDNDADLDLAVVAQNSSGNMVTALFRNDSPAGGGLIIFTDISQEQGEGLNPLMVRATDIDNDGFDDLLMITDTVTFRSGTAIGSTQTVLNDFEDDTPCPSDLDGNNTVNVDDLLLLIGAWGDTSGVADINADGIVDVNDMLLLIGAWGDCTQ